MAGITSVVMTYPLDITRTRLSVQSSSLPTIRHPPTTTTSPTTTPGHPSPPKLPGMFPTIARIYRTEGGIPALYRGLVPTVLGVAPYVGLNFAVYEHVRKLVTPQGEKNPSAVGKLVAGGVSGAVAQTITYPMDVLRRRFQVFIPDPPRKRLQGRNTVWPRRAPLCLYFICWFVGLLVGICVLRVALRLWIVVDW
jgi:solute carrier family 25 (mitochondrial phosphate transporter), member 23/24/25/41